MAGCLLPTAQCLFPHTPHKTPKRPQLPHLSGSRTNQLPICFSLAPSETIGLGHETTERPQPANYQPNGCKMVESARAEILQEASRISTMEEEIRTMLNNEDTEAFTMFELIDDIQRLGLKYRFEGHIKKALARFVSKGSYGKIVSCTTSLHATALRFRLLRQYGFDVRQDVFEEFTDHKGNFKPCLCKDHQGMLSLLEASYLAFEGENLLEEATIFTQNFFKELNLSDVEKVISQQVTQSLEIPLHRRMQRLESRWHIDAYNEKKGANSKLFDLAKLDFNLVQSLHQQEIQELGRWWKNLGLANKLSFARDRTMECFFWTVGIIPDPQFSYCRKELTKVVALVTIVDDIYDVHGTLDELESFTKSIERWDVGSVENLPNYMKLCFLALYNTVNEMAYNTLKEQGENIIPPLTKVWADLCKAFLQEAKWNTKKIQPKFKEYLDNALVSASGMLCLSHAYLLTAENLTTQGLNCLKNYHALDLLSLPSLVFRLCNDLSTSSVEIKRGEIANSISCYMNDTGVTKEVACEYMRSLINETWKKINRFTFYETPFGTHFVEIATNLARISQCHYQYGDGHRAPDSRAKNRVYKLFIEPIS